MKINNYESVLVLNASLEDEQIDSSLRKIYESIKSYGGEIKDVENWGRKRLAYPIKKAKSGYYAIIRFVAPTDAIARIERIYRLDESIIRFLTVELTKEALDFFDAQKNKAANAEISAEVESTENKETATAKAE